MVDAAGKIVLNADNLEGSGTVWSSNDSGIVTKNSSSSEMARTVGMSDMSVFIGDIDN